MIDLSVYRDVNGIQRVALVQRIRILCDEVWRLRSEATDSTIVLTRTLRDNQQLTANVTALQTRCSELLEEVRALRKELKR